MKQEKYLNGSVCLLDGVRLDKKMESNEENCPYWIEICRH
jgi:hypothetical protein